MPNTEKRHDHVIEQIGLRHECARAQLGDVLVVFLKNVGFVQLPGRAVIVEITDSARERRSKRQGLNFITVRSIAAEIVDAAGFID